MATGRRDRSRRRRHPPTRRGGRPRSRRHPRRRRRGSARRRGSGEPGGPGRGRRPDGRARHPPIMADGARGASRRRVAQRRVGPAADPPEERLEDRRRALLPVRGPVAGPDDPPDVHAVRVGHADVGQPDRLLRGSAVRPGDPGHRRRHARPEARSRALGHRPRDLRAHGAVRGERGRVDAEQVALRLVGVRDRRRRGSTRWSRERAVIAAATIPPVHDSATATVTRRRGPRPGAAGRARRAPRRPRAWPPRRLRRRTVVPGHAAYWCWVRAGAAGGWKSHVSGMPRLPSAPSDWPFRLNEVAPEEPGPDLDGVLAREGQDGPRGIRPAGAPDGRVDLAVDPDLDPGRSALDRHDEVDALVGDRHVAGERRRLALVARGGRGDRPAAGRQLERVVAGVPRAVVRRPGS